MYICSNMYNFKQLQTASGKFLVKDFIHFGNERFYNLEVWMLALDPGLTRLSLHLLLNFLKFKFLQSPKIKPMALSPHFL